MSDEEVTRARILNLLDQIESLLSQVKIKFELTGGKSDDGQY